MILTKKQIMELLQILPSDKDPECTPIILEIRNRLKDELRDITDMERAGNNLFMQFMKRVGHFSTKDYEFQYMAQSDGVTVIRRSTGKICANACSEDSIICPVQYRDRDYHLPKFVTCCTCGMPIQEGYLFGSKNATGYDCCNCFSTKMNQKYGKGKWQFTEKITLGDDNIDA